jgi:L-2-hydroxycarboxylate dehydrogenase (NAD+)
MRIDAFRPASDFKMHMDNWIQGFRNATPMAGQDRVLVPGDPEREFEKERAKNGIPLLDAVTADLSELADKFSIPFITG